MSFKLILKPIVNLLLKKSYYYQKVSNRIQSVFDVMSVHSSRKAAEDYHAFFETLVNQFNKKQFAYFYSVLDEGQLLQAITGGLDFSKKKEKKFHRDFRYGATHKLHKWFHVKGEVKLISVHGDPSGCSASAVIRCDNFGETYRYFVLFANKNNRIRLVDWHIMWYGFRMSEKCRLFYQEENILPGTGGVGLKALAEFIEKEDLPRIEESYGYLPKEVFQYRSIMCDLLVLAAQYARHTFVERLLNDLEEIYPNEPYYRLSILWYFLEHEGIESVLQIIDDFAGWYQLKDAGIWHMKALQCKEAGYMEQALYYAKEALKVDSSFKAALFMQADLCNQLEKYQDLVRIIERLRDDFGVRISTERFPEYQAFHQSREYQEWKAKQK